MELNRLGRPFCRKQKPTLFLRLAMKMSHIQPEKEKVVDSSKTTISRGYQQRFLSFDHGRRYVRILGAFCFTQTDLVTDV
ncbi:hypothetical protein HPP92_021396 [Vanilla planifolia]|uniref:Uncharacterized protein n=1 Tax=Vanilla planifolia TaxID=51239 RepID=A0A835Q115_VANPL|nr:hypothetical protein HPP92_021396 [Vanilla planifolia]